MILSHCVAALTLHWMQYQDLWEPKLSQPSGNLQQLLALAQSCFCLSIECSCFGASWLFIYTVIISKSTQLIVCSIVTFHMLFSSKQKVKIPSPHFITLLLHHLRGLASFLLGFPPYTQLPQLCQLGATLKAGGLQCYFPAWAKLLSYGNDRNRIQLKLILRRE